MDICILYNAKQKEKKVMSKAAVKNLDESSYFHGCEHSKIYIKKKG